MIDFADSPLGERIQPMPFLIKISESGACLDGSSGAVTIRPDTLRYTVNSREDPEEVLGVISFLQPTWASIEEDEEKLRWL
jgi:hypothetical protein